MEEENLLEHIYRDAFPAAAALVRKMGGDASQAKDIFHDAMVIYMEKKNKPDFDLRTSPVHYILGVVRILTLHKLKGEKSVLYLDEWPEMEETAETNDPGTVSSLLDHLQAVGQRCLKMLQAFYYHQWDMRKIAAEFNYTSVRSATVQKYKCLERARSEIKKTEIYEEFTA